MDYTNLLGTLAAILTSISFIPQTLKIIRTRDTKSISLPMYILFVGGVLAWLIYGFLLHNFPIILANIVTLTFSGIILIFKIIDVIKMRNN